jgi:hypothetical protein
VRPELGSGQRRHRLVVVLARPPRTYFNKASVSQEVDTEGFVTDRLARFIASKHGYRGRNYGLLVLMGHGYLGVTRLVESVRYGAVHAVR